MRPNGELEKNLVRLVLKFLFGLSSGAILLDGRNHLVRSDPLASISRAGTFTLMIHRADLSYFPAETMSPSQAVAKIQATFGLVQSGV